MNFFFKKKIKNKKNKDTDRFNGWSKCKNCEELIHLDELKVKLNCCPSCNFHNYLSVQARLDLITDKDSFNELFENIHAKDPLNFSYLETTYKEKIEEEKKKTNYTEAITVGVCKIFDITTAIGVMNFKFMGGSMGSAVGEKITRLIEFAIDKSIPLVIVSSSGGARMQESILSLMQMAKVSAALTKLHMKKLPFISVLTNPTTGGVLASFASLGDITIAEPNALIGFAGPRVIEQTIGHKLPKEAQKSEFLLEKGMIDCIIERKYLKEKIFFFIDFLTKDKKDEKNKYIRK